MSVFVLGVNDGVLPQRIDNEGILSDADREWFSDIGFELAPTSKMKLMDETFMAYRAFTSPREQLYVPIRLQMRKGKRLFRRCILPGFSSFLQGTKRIYAVTDPSELLNEEDSSTI